VFLIAEWHQNGRIPLRRLVWMAGSGIVIAGLPALFNRSAIGNVVHYYLHRPPEIGSLAAGLSLVDWHRLGFVSSFHSINVLSPLVSPLSTALEVAALVGCLWTWWMQSRHRLPIEAACLASLTFLVLGSKVGSVQYLMWLMPFWALYRVRVTWAMACIANSVVFPFTVSADTVGHLTARSYAITLVLTFLTRDALIAAGTWLCLREVMSQRATGPMTAKSGLSNLP
jgi:hypothetical protein